MGRTLRVSFVVIALLCVAAPAGTQTPDKFTNLKVLPADISKRDLESTMRGFAFALGVRCNHCHVEKKAPEKGFDFAADEKETKQTARVMLRMVQSINQDFIAKLETEDKAAPLRVECATCHHGLTHPQTLNTLLAASLEKDGLEKTLALYGDLRSKYYGTGQYDFGETPLDLLAESLLARQKKVEALAVMELNFSQNHPDSVWSYHMLAMAHQVNGQIDKTIADYRKVLALHPDDSWAQQQIDALSKPQ